MPRRDDSPALAPNWRTVLLVDGLVGVAIVALGAWAMARSSIAVGAALVAAGVMYAGLVGRRAFRWRRLRREEGLR